jgi:hypothetical protein
MVLSFGVVRLLDGLRPALGLGISIVGATSASAHVHAALAPIAIAFQSLGLGSLFFRPHGLR